MGVSYLKQKANRDLIVYKDAAQSKEKCQSAALRHRLAASARALSTGKDVAVAALRWHMQE